MILYQEYCRDCGRSYEAYEPGTTLCDECECKLALARYEATSAAFDRLPQDEQEREIAATTAALRRALDAVASKGGQDGDYPSR